MQTNRTPIALTALIILAAAMLAMRQPINLDELDQRTIAHARRIAQLEMEIGALEKELNQIRANCCGNEADPRPNPEPADEAALPAHDGDTYFFEITEIRALEQNEALQTEAERIDEKVQALEKQIDSRKNRFGQDLTEAERRALIAQASKLREQAKQLRLQFENPGIVLSGSDADSRVTTVTVTGPGQRAARRFKPGQIAKVRGEVTVFTQDTLVIDNATILPHRTD